MQEILDHIVLSTGSHSTRTDGMCLLEAVAYLANEPHSDHPACASLVLAAFGRTLNDSSLFTDHLEELKPLALQLVNSAASAEIERQRMFFLVDWSIRTILPLSFDGSNLAEVAVALRALAPIVDESAAWSAWSAARSAA